jgi:DNA-binding beta-propeller fold protein YncE
VLWEATGGAPLKHDAAEAVMHQRQNGRVLAALLLGLAVHSGCTGVPDSATPRGAAGSAATAATPRASGLGDGTRPAQYFGYVMSQQSSTLLVLDTSRNEVIKKVTHPDMVKPASGRFHPTKRRYYAGGTGKVTIWDTTDLANPVYLKTLIPAAESVGEYRGFLIYQGSTTAIDGEVWMTNIQDSRVYVYRAADLEGGTPTPVKVFDSTDGVSGPHYIESRPGTNEVWLTNRTATTNGYLLRFDGVTHTVLTMPATRLETTATPGDEPNEFAFSGDGLLAYVGHHGADQLDVAIIDAVGFRVEKLVPLISTAKSPAFMDIDLNAGRVYFMARRSPMLVVVDIKTERVLRYIEFGGVGVGYGVATTPDKKYLYISIGVPEQSAVAVVEARTLTIVANILDSDLNGPRNVRFTSY